LVYELFRGTISREQLAWSETQTRDFMTNRKTANPRLCAAVGLEIIIGTCSFRRALKTDS
jgi:hypothetical protein